MVDGLTCSAAAARGIDPAQASMAPSIAAARDRLRRVGFRMRSVDPVTTELVRIRNGRFQNCFF